MATIWITYAWADNEHQDVDFIAQELVAAGLEVKLDRWNINAGRRLWEQIERFIVDEGESDAWLLVATQNSLASEPCKEEFAYALDRALRSRGGEFPVIALFPSRVDDGLIPAGIRTRLFVSATDPDWKERIVAASNHRAPKIQRNTVDAYYIRIHKDVDPEKPFAIEVCPRAGVWAPFLAGIPANEHERVDPSIMISARGRPTRTGALRNSGRALSDDGNLWLMSAGDEATPTQSYFVFCKVLPSALIFGVNGGQPQFNVRLGANAI